MSNIRVRRLVENITSKTNIYGAIAEAVVNGIDAIEEDGGASGEIVIRVQRAKQRTLTDGVFSEVTGLCVSDNGVGFTDTHYHSFDTLYTEHKVKKGGKEFGRFVCLKHFNKFRVESVYKQEDKFFQRSFCMGHEDAIVENEEHKETDIKITGSKVFLEEIVREQALDKKLQTIASFLIEILLPYFIDKKYKCPQIVLTEEDGNEQIVLNDFLGNELASKIVEIELDNSSFFCHSSIQDAKHEFTIRLFKIYSPKNQKRFLAVSSG